MIGSVLYCFLLISLLVTQIGIFFYNSESPYVWIFTVALCLSMCFRFRRVVPVFLILIFFIPYFYVPKYYFFDGLNISYWADYQSAYLINKVALINSIFLVSFACGLGLSLNTLGKKVFWMGEGKDSLLFYLFLFVSLIPLFFGIRGEGILTSGGYSLVEVNKSPLHEYFLIPYLMMFIFIDKESLVQKAIIFSLLVIYVLKTLIYGGRIEILQVGLLAIYFWYSFHYKNYYVLLSLVAVAGFLFYLFSEFRTNPQEFSLIGSLYRLFEFDNVSTDYMSNQFGDVYQSSLRILGLFEDGYIGFNDSILSFISVIFGLFIPSSLLPDSYNLATYRNDIAFSGGGGFLPAYSYIWLSYFGPILFGIFIGMVAKNIYKKSFFIPVYSILVLVTFPRWFAYYPVVLFKMCLLGVGIYLILVLYKRSFRAEVGKE